MGADFIGTFIEMTASRDLAFARLAEMTEDKLDAFYEDYFTVIPGPDEARTYYTEHLTILYDQMPRRRDVSYWRMGDKTYIVTGGMSGGDDPTEAFDVILSLRPLRLTE